jgi:capsule polysaccharide export protein KpsE/RkpR
MNNRDNLLGIIAAIYRWRKAIRNVCIVVLAGSIGLSLLMRDYYKAVTIFYPASPELASPELIFGYTSQVTQYFGSDRDLDRIAEIANSNEVVDFMVDHFKLYQQYGIDSTSAKGPYKVREIFLSLYSAQKNKNDAIEVSVEDVNPKLAAEMATAARNKINEIAQRLIKSSQATILMSFEDNIRRKNIDLARLADSLRTLQSKYGIYSIGAQGDRLSTQLANAGSEITHAKARLKVLENNPDIDRDTIEYIKANLLAYQEEQKKLSSRTPNADELTLPRFSEGAPNVSVLADLHFQARKQLTFDLERYNQIKAAYNTNIPAIHVIEQAQVPMVKSRPHRVVIVLASVLAAFFFSVLGVMLVEAYREVNWKEVLQQGA